MNNNKEEIKWCKDNHSQPSRDWCPLCLQAVGTLKDNSCSLQPSMPPAPSSSTTTFSYWAQRYKYGICLGPHGVIWFSCVLSTPWPSPLYLLGTEGGKNDKGLKLRRQSSAIAKELVYYEHCFSQNSTLPYQLLWQKKTSIPVSPSTRIWHLF